MQEANRLKINSASVAKNFASSSVQNLINGLREVPICVFIQPQFG